LVVSIIVPCCVGWFGVVFMVPCGVQPARKKHIEAVTINVEVVVFCIGFLLKRYLTSS